MELDFINHTKFCEECIDRAKGYILEGEIRRRTRSNVKVSVLANAVIYEDYADWSLREKIDHLLLLLNDERKKSLDKQIGLKYLEASIRKCKHTLNQQYGWLTSKIKCLSVLIARLNSEEAENKRMIDSLANEVVSIKDKLKSVDDYGIIQYRQTLLDKKRERNSQIRKLQMLLVKRELTLKLQTDIESKIFSKEFRRFLEDTKISAQSITKPSAVDVQTESMLNHVDPSDAMMTTRSNQVSTTTYSTQYSNIPRSYDQVSVSPPCTNHNSSQYHSLRGTEEKISCPLKVIDKFNRWALETEVKKFDFREASSLAMKFSRMWVEENEKHVTRLLESIDTAKKACELLKKDTIECLNQQRSLQVRIDALEDKEEYFFSEPTPTPSRILRSGSKKIISDDDSGEEFFEINLS